MRLQQFSVNVMYKKGTSLVLADTLSHVPLPQVMTPKQPSLEIFCLEIERNDLHVNTQITSKTMAKLQEATKADPVMNSLERTIVNGWPLEKRCLPSCLTPYWNIRDEMSVADDVVYRGTQAIIPSSMQKEMLKTRPLPRCVSPAEH